MNGRAEMTRIRKLTPQTAAANFWDQMAWRKKAVHDTLIGLDQAQMVMSGPNEQGAKSITTKGFCLETKHVLQGTAKLEGTKKA